MDQESFRKLLQTPRPGGTPTATSTRGALLKPKAGPSKPKAASSADPDFKPRKVKKASGLGYRDRAEERRLGKESDYAQVEAVLEDFERQNAENEDKLAVEEQRRYLGGDSDHSILVKGLDFALLEQNKARLESVTSKQDDELLEEVFAQASSAPAPAEAPPTTKKRSRADIIKELKEKRAGGGGGTDATPTEPEKPPAPGKFKPIGFKPIGGVAEEPGKRKKKVKADGGERKKKKRKMEGALEGAHDGTAAGTSGRGDAGKGDMLPPLPPPPPPALTKATPAPPKIPEPEGFDEDLNIFADTGEYQGIDLGSDSDSEPPESREKSRSPRALLPPPPQRRGWFHDNAEPAPSAVAAPASNVKSKTRSRSPMAVDMEDGEEEEEGQFRLVPLASSAIPSIRDLLAIDDAAGKQQKRKAKKEKGKGNGTAGGDGGGNKTERDYQRLKSYEAKKAGK